MLRTYVQDERDADGARAAQKTAAPVAMSGAKPSPEQINGREPPIESDGGNDEHQVILRSEMIAAPLAREGAKPGTGNADVVEDVVEVKDAQHDLVRRVSPRRFG